jgi:outer membrane cobalamin receptor
VKKNLFILLFSILASSAVYAQKVTVSGYLNDAKSGECLISAAVYDSLTSSGTVSNDYGFYSLTLSKGHANLSYSYVGYEPFSVELDLTRDTVIDVRLVPSMSFLHEASVTASRSELGVRGTQMSAIEVPVRQIKMVPALFGEVDVIKALQLLPGVQSGNEGSAGLYVRGGGPDENLLLLDGVPLYGVNHLFGFFSVFNADAIKNVTLYKGSFPARFGSRLSSVVDIRTNDGNENEYHGSVSIGLVAAKFNFEGPIVKGKTTFNISGRRTYIDLLTAPLMALEMKEESNESDGNGTSSGSEGYYFYDFNAKITHKFSDNDHLYLSYYKGRDNVYASAHSSEEDSYNLGDSDIPTYYDENLKFTWNWGNVVGALRWNHVFNPKLFVNASVSYTNYSHVLGENVKISEEKDQENLECDESIKYASGIDDIAANADFEYKPVPAHDIKFGTGYIFHTYRPGVTTSFSTNYLIDGMAGNIALGDTTIGNKNIFSHEISVYAEDNYDITNYLKLDAGIRGSFYAVEGETYHSLEPRLGIRLLLASNLSVKASYALMTQYVHLLSNTDLSLPSDLWVPVTSNVKPMVSSQVALGLFYTLRNIDFSVEGYYKGMDNVIEYRDGASFLGSASDWESKVCSGIGWAYGVEFMAQKKVGNTTGWIAYTWSKSMRLFNREGNIINFGEPFYSKYDRRHDLSITLNHTFSRRFDLSGTFIYCTGNCGTLAMQTYPQGIISVDNPYGFSSLSIGGYVSGRNNYRMPSYNRMDIGCNFHHYFKSHPTWQRIWNISIYNVYNRLNPFLVYMDYDSDTNKKVMKKVSLFPIIPSVTYTFKF